jgi:translation initiation factor IF-3
VDYFLPRLAVQSFSDPRSFTITRKDLAPKPTSIADTIRINSEIRARDVRVIDITGEQLGILSIRDALNIATQKELDLVEVAPNADPPVCRLMDYGKYLFEKQKRERESRRAQKVIEVKELRLRPKTDDHDIEVVITKIRKFVKEGAKVRVRIRFRGREMQHPEVGRDLLDRVARDVADVTILEQTPALDGSSSMLMILAPAKIGREAGGLSAALPQRCRRQSPCYLGNECRKKISSAESLTDCRRSGNLLPCALSKNGRFRPFLLSAERARRMQYRRPSCRS